MLYKVKTGDIDLEKQNAVQCGQPDERDYSGIIVRKPWGYEYLVYENAHVAIWMLHIVRKRKTSMHCHPKKVTSLLLLSGSATCSHMGGEIRVNEMDGVVIQNGAFHSTEASNPEPLFPQSENGIWVMEIEAPPIKHDLVRMDDAYGRAGKSYEGSSHMVFGNKELLRFQTPDIGDIFVRDFIDLRFTLRRGPFSDEKFPGPGAICIIIGKDPEDRTDNPFLKVGEAMYFKDFYANTKDENLGGYTIMTLEKIHKSMKLSDYIFSYIADLGVKDVFAVSGGGAMHLVDSLGRNERLNYVATHHEQAAAMAAEAYARISGNLGVALVTSGPGGTNAITGVCGCWIDSIPSVFISGQVTTNTLIGNTGLRQFGIQESNIVEIVKSVTKYAVTVTDPKTIRYHIEKAAHLATTGRPGPVWLDIPLDVQSQTVNVEELEPFVPETGEDQLYEITDDLRDNVTKALDIIMNSKRPVIISGYGIRLAKAVKEYRELVRMLKVPVVSSWTTSDLIETDDDLYVGRSGIMGDRAGNFSVQNSDCLLVIGSRLSIPQVGYNYKHFAREAWKIVVDIDQAELDKPSISPDVPIRADARAFIVEMIGQLKKRSARPSIDEWIGKCRKWKAKYPVVLPEYYDNKEGVNSFFFIDVLSRKLGNDAVIVTDMGTSFTCSMQTMNTKKGQRFFTSSGHASMGFGLPGAIGACVANNRKKTICISGDGGLMMNLQEMQTIAHYNLPLILFILNNCGYLTIKLMQQNHFGRYVGSDPASGVSCPDFVKVAESFGLKAGRISNQEDLIKNIDSVLREPGPYVCEIVMPEDQPLIPRTSSMKKPDGTIVSKPLEDLYPFLDRKEFAENMIVKPTEILED